MPGIKSLILAFGPESSQFADKFIGELMRGPRDHGLAAFGIYDESRTGLRARARIRRKTWLRSVADISVAAPRDAAPDYERIVELKRRAWAQKAQAMLVILDADYVMRCAATLKDLRAESPNARMTAICLTNQNQEDLAAHAMLEKLTLPDKEHDNLQVLETVFMMSTRSPLSQLSDDSQREMAAKSLAGIWTAPLFGDNPPIVLQGNGVRQPAKPFLGLALRTESLSMSRKGWFRKVLYPVFHFTTLFISADEATARVVDATRSALTHASVKSDTPSSNAPPPKGVAPTTCTTMVVNKPPVATTTVNPFNAEAIHGEPISVNIIIPFRATGEKFRRIKRGVRAALRSNWEAYIQKTHEPPPPKAPSTEQTGYIVNVYSAVKGKGVNLTSNKTLRPLLGLKKGNFYCQVCVLYAVGRAELATPSAQPPTTTTQNPTNPTQNPVNPAPNNTSEVPNGIDANGISANGISANGIDANSIDANSIARPTNPVVAPDTVGVVNSSGRPPN